MNYGHDNVVFFQAEVQSTYSDGALSLHTRSLKYGKVSSVKFHYRVHLLRLSLIISLVTSIYKNSPPIQTVHCPFTHEGGGTRKVKESS